MVAFSVSFRRASTILLLALVVGCKTTSSSESETHAAVTVQQDTSLARNETRTVTQGPETVTTTIEEFDVQQRGQPEGGVRHVPYIPTTGTATGTEGARALEQPPTIIRRTTVVDVRGPIVAQTALQATAATETHAAAKAESQAESKRSMRPAGLFGLWWLLPVALAALGWFKRDLLLGLVKKVVG